MQSARAMASCCCSPPERVPETCDRRSRRRGNRASDPLAGRRSVAAGHQADLEVLGDGELGEEAPALRHPGDALARHEVSGQAVERGVAIERDRPGGGAARAP